MAERTWDVTIEWREAKNVAKQTETRRVTACTPEGAVRLASMGGKTRKEIPFQQVIRVVAEAH
jgi:hypothetical protein